MKLKVTHYIILLYFFFNSFLLPKGLLYTIFLTPVFYYWLALRKQKLVISYFLLFSLPFILGHILLNNLDFFRYVRSYVLVFTVYIFIFTVRVYLKQSLDLEKVFFKLLLYNFVFVLLALILLFTPFRDLLWTNWWISPSVGKAPRLSLLTYEPSYYATLLVPLFFFFFLFFIKKPTSNSFLLLMLIVAPLAFAFSIGVLASISISIFLFLLLQITQKYISERWLQFITLVFFLALFSVLFLLVFYSQNPLFTRVNDILSGADSSGNGRIFQSMELAFAIVSEYNTFFGIGFGQLKVINTDIFMQVYGYVGELTIPNTLAETLAHLGFLGLGLRLFFEFFLFFRTRVYTNHFRLLIFLYVFIYQFTGSFYTNIAEYVLWVFAFTNCFPQFDRKEFSKNVAKSS